MFPRRGRRRERLDCAVCCNYFQLQMGRTEKLLKRLQSKPKDFSWDELTTLLHALGYEVETGGKSGGSRRKFFSAATGNVMFFHKPHPSGILKAYQLKQVIENLKENKLL